MVGLYIYNLRPYLGNIFLFKITTFFNFMAMILATYLKKNYIIIRLAAYTLYSIDSFGDKFYVYIQIFYIFFLDFIIFLEHFFFCVFSILPFFSTNLVFPFTCTVSFKDIIIFLMLPIVFLDCGA